MCETDEAAMHAARKYQNQKAECEDPRTSEHVMVGMIREDLGVVIDPQAWRMFVRYRFGRLAPLAHRIHEGKR